MGILLVLSVNLKQSITYVDGIHWNCLKKAISMCTYNKCHSIN